MGVTVALGLCVTLVVGDETGREAAAEVDARALGDPAVDALS